MGELGKQRGFSPDQLRQLAAQMNLYRAGSAPYNIPCSGAGFSVRTYWLAVHVEGENDEIVHIALVLVDAKPQSAAVERSFSAMGRTKTDHRARMHPSTLNIITTIKSYYRQNDVSVGQQPREKPVRAVHATSMGSGDVTEGVAIALPVLPHAEVEEAAEEAAVEAAEEAYLPEELDKAIADFAAEHPPEVLGYAPVTNQDAAAVMWSGFFGLGIDFHSEIMHEGYQPKDKGPTLRCRLGQHRGDYDVVQELRVETARGQATATIARAVRLATDPAPAPAGQLQGS